MARSITCYFWCFYCSIFAIVIGGIFYTIIFLIIFHPSNVKFYVTDASVTNFNFTNNSTLYFDLAMNITVRNPNNRIAVDYRRVTVIGYYKDNSFGAVNLSPFSQGHKNTTYLNAALSGQQGLLLDGKYLAEYYSETAARAYLINVDIDLDIRVRYGKIKDSLEPPIISCRMKIPVVSSAGKEASSFSFTKCRHIKSFFISRYDDDDNFND